MDASLPSCRSAQASRVVSTDVRSMLVERMAQIEGRVMAAAAADRCGLGAHCGADARRIPTGWAEVDAALGGGIPRRGVHEWWHVDDRSAARAAPVDAFIHLAWQALLHDEQHNPGADRHVVWIGRAVWPRVHALVRGLRVGVRAMFGAPSPRVWPDARLVDRSLFVDTAGDGVAGDGAVRGAPHDAAARVWAIEHAARCQGVCAVIADGAGFDLPATRRLQLAAAEVLLLIARPHERRPTLSACSTRWRVRAVEGDAEPTWVVELERAKGAASASGASCAAVPAIGIRARITRAWEREGVAAPPTKLAAEAERRRIKKISRMAAQAAESIARRRREESVPNEPAPSYPLLPGHHAANVDRVVHRPRRARRAR